MPQEWKFSQRGGDFTILRHIKTLSRSDIEKKVGFEQGRLDKGAVIGVLSRFQIDRLKTTDFTFGGSTRWSRSAAPAPWAPEFTMFTSNGNKRMEPNAIESRLALEGQDPQALKEKVIRFFQTYGDNVPAKVFPTWRDDGKMLYPNVKGAGIPQFRLRDRLESERPWRWMIERVIPPV